MRPSARLLALILALACIAADGVRAQDTPVPLGDPLATAYPPGPVLDTVLLPVTDVPGTWRVLALNDDNTLLVYEGSINDGDLELLAEVPLNEDGYRAVAFDYAPDIRQLYIAFSGTPDSGTAKIVVYDMSNSQMSKVGEYSVPAMDQTIDDLAVSADGTLLISAPLLTGGFADPQVGLFAAPEFAPVLIEEAPVASFSPEMALDWVQTLYDRVRADGVNAPAASRLYGYAGVALYEGLVHGMPDHISLAGQVWGLDFLPQPQVDEVYDWPTVAAASLRVVLTGLMGEESPDSAQAFEALYDAQAAEREAAVASGDMVALSARFGEAVGRAVLASAQTDGYLETRDLNAGFEPPSGDPSYWVPTTEGRAAAEPYWGDLRPFGIADATICSMPLNAPYSEDEGSTFYQQALEVRAVEAALTPQQRAIAEWWVDTPGLTGAPSGHWMLIGSQVIEQQGFNLEQAAELYGMLGMTLADSFISAWSLKYEINLLRPVTYIQRLIDPRWQPYIESPSFPEYPSGHSVASAAAADMLTSLYGALAFTDRANARLGLEPRHFTSFEAAASEAAFSRLYGGIHFRQAIENGLRQGECVATRILDRVTMRRFGQGE